MIVKSLLIAAAQDKRTGLSLSPDTNTYILTIADNEHPLTAAD